MNLLINKPFNHLIYEFISDCRGHLLRLYLDGFYNGYVVDTKFNDMKPYIDAFIDGKTSCVLTHGVTGEPSNYFKKMYILMACFLFGFLRKWQIFHYVWIQK